MTPALSRAPSMSFRQTEASADQAGTLRESAEVASGLRKSREKKHQWLWQREAPY